MNLQLPHTLSGNHMSWLNAARQAALDGFSKSGFPTRKQENWKYTDLSSINLESFQYPAVNALSEKEIFEKFDAYTLIFVNGHLCTEPLAELGFVIGSLGMHLDRSDMSLTKLFSTENEALKNLNTAFFQDGLYVRLKKNTTLEKPIHLLYITTESCMYHPRNIICLEENSKATIFEEHISLNENTYFKNNFTQIQLASNAQLELIKLQNENTNSTHLANTLVHQERDSQFSHYSFSLGSRLHREDISIMLSKSGANCSLQGLYLPSEKQHIDHHTRIDHLESHTQSTEYYKGILKDEATGVFNGKIVVHPKAQKIQSQQYNKNLLLSEKAQVNTKPELEIYADDVQCAHGATVGQLDPEALFYFQSRGIDLLTAQKLLVEAFSEEILNKITHSEILSILQDAVRKKL